MCKRAFYKTACKSNHIVWIAYVIRHAHEHNIQRHHHRSSSDPCCMQLYNLSHYTVSLPTQVVTLIVRSYYVHNAVDVILTGVGTGESGEGRGEAQRWKSEM